ncbi:uncharacterized protein LOC135347766 isoform X2 [Halichondria panicea]|uniref:uncharacterized protein LOC135347766 isoform X2 n=2 Tax=Halichondria panicea TaxID=6063 RepID=UPI00312B534B
MYTMTSLEVLVTVNEQQRGVQFIEGQKNLLAEIKKEFADIIQGSEISLLQIFSTQTGEYLDLNPGVNVCSMSRIKVILKPTQSSETPAKTNIATAKNPLTKKKLRVVICTPAPDTSADDEESDEDDTRIAGAAGAFLTKNKIWKGHEVLKVYFFNSRLLDDWKCIGETMSVNTILAWANGAWRSPLYDDIPKFVLTEFPQTANIRVKLSDSGGCWSMIGTDAQTVRDLMKPTMMLSLCGYCHSLQESLVIHEFGHALGLEHEHQRSDFWDVLEKHFDLDKMKNDSRVSQDSKMNKNRAGFGVDWFKKKVGNTESEVVISNYDHKSIMHYWFDIKWLKDKRLHKPENIDRDTSLSSKEKFYLNGLHKRCLEDQLTKGPSKTDIREVVRAYGGQQIVDEIDTLEGQRGKFREKSLSVYRNAQYLRQSTDSSYLDARPATTSDHIMEEDRVTEFSKSMSSIELKEWLSCRGLCQTDCDRFLAEGFTGASFVLLSETDCRHLGVGMAGRLLVKFLLSQIILGESRNTKKPPSNGAHVHKVLEKKWASSTYQTELQEAAQNPEFDPKLAVKCPKDMDRNSWIAVNVVTFSHRVLAVFKSVCRDCTCPTMSGWHKDEYLWTDTQWTQSVSLPAKEYVARLMGWIKWQTEDRRVFPVEQRKTFPPPFSSACKTILCYLYRVLVHAATHHLDNSTESETKNDFTLCHKHFYFFVNEFNLIDSVEFRPLQILLKAATQRQTQLDH